MWVKNASTWLPPQKTTKTRCGIRVALSRIDNANGDCPGCLVELERERKARIAIREHCESLGIEVPGGFGHGELERERRTEDELERSRR